MSSLTITTLEDVLAHVKTLVPEAECCRAYLPEFDVKKLEKVEKPLLSVILCERDAERETRGNVTTNTFLVDLVVQKKLKVVTNEEIDPCIEIVERLFDTFLTEVVFLASGRKYFCGQPIHGDDAPLIAGKQLREFNCFFGMVQIEVKVNSTC